MKIVSYPTKEELSELVKRSSVKDPTLASTVRSVLARVRQEGDKALLALEQQFDAPLLTDIVVTSAEMEAASAKVDDSLKKAIQTAKRNIELFHRSQKLVVNPVETTPGVVCWQQQVAIQSVGLYIPGGTAPLFSTVLMLGIPATIAGCKEIVLCTPPNKDGSIHPTILYAASLVGITKIFKAGGAQAIAAMSYGTASVPKVHKIFGPGNQYVMEAKMQVSLDGLAIDMPAGPSEVLVVADESASPIFIAADLLSQAEHGKDSQAILVTTSPQLVEEVAAEVEQQLAQLPRQEIAQFSIANSSILLVHTLDEAVAFVNAYAPEHLLLQTKNYREVATQIVNAGSVFLGMYAPESAGDYASGTNHTLPTHGYAKAYSGVNLDSFMKKITYQEITTDGIRSLGPTIEEMALNEELYAHKNAVTVRLDYLQKKK